MHRGLYWLLHCTGVVCAQTHAKDSEDVDDRRPAGIGTVCARGPAIHDVVPLKRPVDGFADPLTIVFRAHEHSFGRAARLLDLLQVLAGVIGPVGCARDGRQDRQEPSGFIVVDDSSEGRWWLLRLPLGALEADGQAFEDDQEAVPPFGVRKRVIIARLAECFGQTGTRRP